MLFAGIKRRWKLHVFFNFFLYKVPPKFAKFWWSCAPHQKYCKLLVARLLFVSSDVILAINHEVRPADAVGSSENVRQSQMISICKIWPKIDPFLWPHDPDNVYWSMWTQKGTSLAGTASMKPLSASVGGLVWPVAFLNIKKPDGEEKTTFHGRLPYPQFRPLLTDLN